MIPAILLGSITSTGGGVLRDVLTGEVPNVLQPGSLYALAAVVGSTTYVLLTVWLGVVKPVAAFAAVAIVLLLRFLSVWLGWQSPTPVDLTPRAGALHPRARAGRSRTPGPPHPRGARSSRAPGGRHRRLRPSGRRPRRANPERTFEPEEGPADEPPRTDGRRAG